MMSLEVHSAPELQIQELTGIIQADGFLIFRWDVWCEPCLDSDVDIAAWMMNERGDLII